MSWISRAIRSRSPGGGRLLGLGEAAGAFLQHRDPVPSRPHSDAEGVGDDERQCRGAQGGRALVEQHQHRHQRSHAGAHHHQQPPQRRRQQRDPIRGHQLSVRQGDVPERASSHGGAEPLLPRAPLASTNELCRPAFAPRSEPSTDSGDPSRDRRQDEQRAGRDRRQDEQRAGRDRRQDEQRAGRDRRQDEQRAGPNPLGEVLGARRALHRALRIPRSRQRRGAEAQVSILGRIQTCAAGRSYRIESAS